MRSRFRRPSGESREKQKRCVYHGALLLIAGTASGEGWYTAVYGGYNFSEAEVEDSSTLAAIELEGEDDFQIGGALGHRFPDSERGNWRAEFDFRYFSSELENETTTALLVPSDDIDVDTYTFIARGLYDFKILSQAKWRPYVGLGIGFVSADVDTVTLTSGARLGDDDTVFAGEVSGGMSYTLNKKTELFTDVRYLIAEELDIDLTGGPLPSNDAEGEIDSLSVNIGIRYEF